MIKCLHGSLEPDEETRKLRKRELWNGKRKKRRELSLVKSNHFLRGFGFAEL